MERRGASSPSVQRLPHASPGRCKHPLSTSTTTPAPTGLAGVSHEMPDLSTIGEPERSICPFDDPFQLTKAQGAATVIEVGIGWKRIECECATGRYAPDGYIGGGGPERAIRAAGDGAKAKAIGGAGGGIWGKH